MYLGVIGLGGYALGSTLWMLGGRQIVDLAAKDQAAATAAWAAVSAVGAALDGLGGAFTGVAAILGGWAILDTKALSSGAAYVGILSGILGVLGLFAAGNPIVMMGGFILTIVWLAWAGSSLRAG
jgi:hypothetical protein